MAISTKSVRIRYYLILAFAGLATILGAVATTRQMAAMQQEAVDRTAAVARQAGRYDTLLQSVEMLARARNAAPAADARQALLAAWREYSNASLAASRGLRETKSDDERRSAQTELATVDGLASRLVSLRTQENRAIETGQRAEGDAIRADIDEVSRTAVDHILRLRSEGRAIQLASIEDVAQRSLEFEQIERAILGLIVLAIVAVIHRTQHVLANEASAREEANRIADLEARNLAFEQAIDGIATFDRDGRFTWTNSKFAAILGYESSELSGVDIRASLVDADPAIITSATEELHATGRAERVLSVRKKNGHVAHVHAVLVLVRSGGGYAFLKDITRQFESDAALRLTEERFGMAMLATGDIISDWDIVNDRLWMNDAIHALLGYPDDLQPSIDQWIDAVHPDDQQAMLQRMNDAFADRTEYWTSEYRLRRFDGTHAYVFERSYVVRDSDGMPIRLITALTDISARRKAEEDLERMSVQNRMILSSAADGIIGVDTNATVTLINPAATELLGWTSDDLAGRPLHEVIHTDELGNPAPSNRCYVKEALTQGVAGRGNAAYRRKNGSQVNVEFSCQPMVDAAGRIVGAVLTFRDITERLAVERMKDEFVSIVSHELRTPLTSIRGALGLVAGGRAGEVPPKAGRMLEIAVSNTDRLIRLINEILDLERIDSGKVTLSPQLCQASDLIRDAIDEMKPLADQSSIRLETSCDQGVLFADRDRVLQTLTNLIDNAIKFSPAGSAVTISAREEESQIRFCIEDRGRGIPKEKLTSIFERFQQVDATDSRQKGGTGLGLAICRSIVRQHGGEIRAENRDGEGSRFVFTLPRVRAAAADTGATRKGLVFVCEDDEIIRDVEVELLEQAGYDVVGVESGAGLLSHDRLTLADAVVLDMGLPDMSGSEVSARLLEQQTTRRIPILIVSGSAKESVTANVSAWLMKPLAVDDLLSAVADAIATRRRARVLLVEDDLDLARVLTASLDAMGIETCHAATGAQAIQLAQQATPELIVLDPTLPELDGFAVIDYFKDHGLLGAVPLIVYSTNETSPSERDRLRLGPTQFLTKSRVSPDAFEQHVLRTLESISGRRELSDVA